MRFVIPAVFLALVVTLLAVPAVKADGCRRVSAVSYSAPVYHASYGYETVVPYAIPVAVFPPTYFQVDPSLAQARIIQVATEDAATKAAAKTMEQFLAVLQQQQRPNPGPLAPPGSPPEAVAAKPPGNPNTRLAAPIDVVKNMVATSCIQCHGQGTGHLELTDLSKLSEIQWFKVEHRLMSGDPNVVMPKPGGNRKPVSAEELDAVHAVINGLKK